MTILFEPLANIIHDHITTSGGSISFARFMELALYHPQGYYQGADFTLGREGDFTTAPEISPLFAQCFAKQCQQIASQLNDNTILEIGAGTGAFACELLKSLAAKNALPNHYYIYDISPVLRTKQREYLAMHCAEHSDRVTWIETMPTDFSGTIIANEVLDALPVCCFQIEKNSIYERVVTTNDGQFDWQTAPATGELLAAVTQLKTECSLSEGYQSEICLQLPSFIHSLASSLTRGVILLADYGYGRREYYHPQRRHGTLTCFYQHRHHDNPLLLPGLQDITVHVDFTAVAEAAVAAGLEINGYTTQAAFLLANGLMTLADQQEQLLSEPDRFKLHQAIKTLTLPTEMGDLIKIMGLTKDCSLELSGFSLLNRLRDL
jgi:SAM-dependent MidA family methyltransferase